MEPTKVAKSSMCRTDTYYPVHHLCLPVWQLIHRNSGYLRRDMNEATQVSLPKLPW